jgi:hypothetical protein
MTLANIDTFEHDIEHEMKSKEVTVRDIATSRGDIGNEHPEEEAPKKNILAYIAGCIVFLSLALVGGYFGYSYYLDVQEARIKAAQALALPAVKTTEDLLSDISQDFTDNIGRYVSKVEKRPEGYIITITSYATVFSYLIKNESVFADRVAYVLGVEKGVRGDLSSQMAMPTTVQVVPIPIVAQENDTSTTTSTSTKKIVPPTKKPVTKPTPGASATTSTSTLVTASSTAITTPVVASTSAEQPIQKDMTPIPFTFSDITVSNQNMRMAQSGNARFYYAFIQNKAVVFSNSTDGILKLRDAILR